MGNGDWATHRFLLRGQLLVADLAHEQDAVAEVGDAKANVGGDAETYWAWPAPVTLAPPGCLAGWRRVVPPGRRAFVKRGKKNLR